VRTFILIVSAMLLSHAQPAEAEITIQHLNTASPHQGYCPVHFAFQSPSETVSKLRISFDVLDAKGTRIGSETLTFDEKFGGTRADEGAEASVESRTLCASGLRLVITSATAVVGGRQTDLLKSNLLGVRQFKPFEIQLRK